MLKVTGIDRAVLDTINRSARASYPKEFIAALRAEDGIITEILLIPGSLQGDDNATILFHMIPVDLSVVGTVHSHPGGIPKPSDADLDLFRRHGVVHIITASPFNEHSWRAYDGAGRRRELEVVDLGW
jgi:proteasome lid subunit RPN8/RPN11